MTLPVCHADIFCWTRWASCLDDVHTFYFWRHAFVNAQFTLQQPWSVVTSCHVRRRNTRRETACL